MDISYNDPRRSPRGFATMLAVLSLLLVGITLACLMRRFSSQAVLTREEADRAQLRQILIAGAMGTPQSPVRLPGRLQQSGGGISVIFSKNEWPTVEAEFGNRHAQWAGK